MKAYAYTLSIGPIALCEDNGFITNLYLNASNLQQGIAYESTPLLDEAAEQLKHYLSGELQAFSLPLSPSGTPFMQRVWSLLLEIPYGQTVSYRDLAKRIGQSGASRAVGLANSRNPIPILIPCHRVIGSDGSLKGYLGGMELKQKLLELERTQFEKIPLL